MILNGPNLNLLGNREPEVYGHEKFMPFLDGLKKRFSEHQIDYFQSNHCGELIDKIQGATTYNGVIINAGGYTHTSVALGDAVKSLKPPFIEVHISNIYARSPFRNNSYLSKHAKAVICGMGLNGYRFAVEELLS